jgi:uncharacterized protein
MNVGEHHTTVMATLPERLWAWARGLPRLVLLGAVRGYRLFFSAWVGNCCRYEPSCSTYALTALQRFGALQGGALMTSRLLRCHPWCAGGDDPVPPPEAGLFTRLGLSRHATESISTREST